MPKAPCLEKLKISLTLHTHFVYLTNGQMASGAQTTALGSSLWAGQPYLRETDYI